MPAKRARSPTNLEHSTLASSNALRPGQAKRLAWLLMGGVTLLVSYGIAMGLVRAGWASHRFPHTVLWCALPYVFAAYSIYRGAWLPAPERTSLLLVATVTPFLLLILGFALLQQPYSRGAVLLVYVLATAWFVMGDWLRRRHHVQRLFCLDPIIPERLSTWCGTGGLHAGDIELCLLPADTAKLDEFLAFDGVVVDRRVPANTERSQLLSQIKFNHMQIYSVEAVAELLSGRKMLPTAQDDLWQMDGNPAYDVAKRVMDVLMVLVTAPLWLALCATVWVAVQLDSHGPVLYSQLRTGRDGHPFRLWKFRSMRHTPLPEAVQFAKAHDARVTRIGRFIRRWRLDELPQLVNVLLGHMSLIGPRPEQVEFVEEFAARIPAYTYRHLVRPGLTGWAQIQHGYTDSEEGTKVKLSYDLYYVANYSVAMDLLIIFKTLRIMFSGFGAR